MTALLANDLWANAGVQTTPGAALNDSGFVCGAADPNIFNFLFNRALLGAYNAENHAIVRNVAGLVIPAGVYTTIPWPTVVSDPEGLFDVGFSGWRIPAVVAGTPTVTKIKVTGQIGLLGDATDAYTDLHLGINGAVVTTPILAASTSEIVNNTGIPVWQITTPWISVLPNDLITLHVFSTAAKTMGTAANWFQLQVLRGV